jgi:GNAT superfamily N-acetyltransferase
MITIRSYDKTDNDAFFAMIEKEGGEWEGYINAKGRPMYERALRTSQVFLAFDEGLLAGFVRVRDDDGFGVYVYDLLVLGPHRGKAIGKALLDHVRMTFEDAPFYVMSDADGYYEKLGYKKIGSVLTPGDSGN